MALTDRLETKGQLINAAESLLYCIENDNAEDAFQWLLQLLDGLYSKEVGRRAKLENAIDEARQ